MNYKIIGGDQKEYGPVTPDELRSWIAEGRANGETLVQPEGGTGWRALSSFPELVALLGPAPAIIAPITVAPLPSSLAADVPNYLVQAILCTVCCCVPLGIPAIVYAAQVNTKISAGDVEGARLASKNARMWCWIAFASGAAATLLYLIVLAATQGLK